MLDKGRCLPNWDDGTCQGSIRPNSKGIYGVRACHIAAAVSARFDEPNLVPVLRLAERAGLHAVAHQRIRLRACAGSAAANTGAKMAHHAEQTRQAAERVAPAPAPGYRADTLDVLFGNVPSWPSSRGAGPRLVGGPTSPARRQAARTRFPARSVVADWPATAAPRAQVVYLLTRAPFVLDNANSQEKR